MLFPNRHTWLPLLIYLSMMDPSQWIHWTGFGLLILLMQYRDEWNLWVLPAILLILLPALYLSLISLPLFLAVACSYPLVIKRGWIKESKVMGLASLWLALLAFFAGPLAIMAVAFALLIWLPWRYSLAGILVLFFLWLLPLGKTPWAQWLGQVSTPENIPPSLTPLPPPAESSTSPVSTITPGWLASFLPWLEKFSEILLFVFFALAFALVLRLLWLMRKQARVLKKGFLLLLLLLLMASLSIPALRWLGSRLSQREYASTMPADIEAPLPPSITMPEPADSPAPLPQEPLPPLPQPWPYRDFFTLTAYIVFLAGLCLGLYYFLRMAWQIPALSASKGEARSTSKSSKDTDSPLRYDFPWHGRDLILHGYELLRSRYLRAKSSLTPLELCEQVQGKSFQRLSDAYIQLRYARSPILPDEQSILAWINECLNEK